MKSSTDAITEELDEEIDLEAKPEDSLACIVVPKHDVAYQRTVQL